MKNIVILGAGRVGSIIALALAGDKKWNLTVADLSASALTRLSWSPLATQQRDLARASEVREAVKHADLVVGAVPGYLGFQTMETVLSAGKDMVDISFFEEDPFRLDALARERGLIAIPDCGIAPGCSNLILGYLQQRLDQVTRFECLVGGLPVVRTLPWEYKAGFSPMDVLEEYTRPARYVAHGREVVLPALSEPEIFDFPGVGTLEAFNTDGLRTLLHTVDAPFMKEKTLRYPGHAAKMRMLQETGFFGKEPIMVGGTLIAPFELTARMLLPKWQMGEGDEDFTLMRVVVEGEKDGQPQRHVYNLLDRYDPVTRTTSMARTTGFTCAAAVRMVLAGLYTRKGISPPEFVGREDGCWTFIREDLARHGVVFTETAEVGNRTPELSLHTKSS